MAEKCLLEDEQRVMAQLATLGSLSAAIIRRLQLTRKVLMEATRMLLDERRAQNNLLAVLGASRYKVVTKQGLCDTRCPLRHCQREDSFDHMLQCYDSESSVEYGAAAAPFLVRMARKTQIIDDKASRVCRGGNL